MGRKDRHLKDLWFKLWQTKYQWYDVLSMRRKKKRTDNQKRKTQARLEERFATTEALTQLEIIDMEAPKK